MWSGWTSASWKTRLEGGFPIITASAVVAGGVAYVGVASYEEALVRFGFPLTFRGSVLAVDTQTGAIRWQTYMAPQDYTGAAVWGSSPAIDTARNQLYVATGNNYSVPAEVTACIGEATTPSERAACVDPSDFFDSVVAVDLTTGAVKWAHKALPDDAWNLSCGIYFIPGLDFEVPGCPDNEGPDYDFGQGPALFKVMGAGGKPQELVGAGQKSGVYWALDANTGAVVWSTQAGPGGLHAESVNALEPATGRLLWSVPFESRYGMTAPTPRLAGDVLFVTAFYNGSLALRLGAGTPEVLWRSPKASEKDTTYLHSIISTPFIEGGHIYGVCSYGQLRCLELGTGRRLWETLAATTPEQETRWGNAFLVKHQDRYFLFNERGELILARLSPQGYEEIDRMLLLEPTNRDRRYGLVRAQVRPPTARTDLLRQPAGGAAGNRRARRRAAVFESRQPRPHCRDWSQTVLRPQERDRQAEPERRDQLGEVAGDQPGFSGYSDLCVWPDGTIYCLYERGAVTSYYDPAAVALASFDLRQCLPAIPGERDDK